MKPTDSTVVPFDATKRRRGPTSKAPQIMQAAEILINNCGLVPPDDITWKEFHKKVCERIGVAADTRGFGQDSVENAVRQILRERRDKNTERTEN
jgi:hypothetical protein